MRWAAMDAKSTWFDARFGLTGRSKSERRYRIECVCGRFGVISMSGAGWKARFWRRA
jgi:hypothetical protein